jgi:hypothetical protein
LLEFLKGGKRLSTAELVSAFYGRRKPLNARIRIMNLVRSIKAKALVKMKTTERAGPHPIEVWVEGSTG